jgi:DNA-binding SARP family transcriptional activator
MSERDTPAVRFDVLGPLRAERAGTGLNLGSVQQQVVLAVLLLHANRSVGRQQLIDAVWGADAPAYAVNLVQKHVSALRRVLEPGRSDRQPSRLAWTQSGYRLSVYDGALDLHAFEAELDRARSARARGDLATTGAALRAALGLWRGPLCDGLESPLLDAERDRLAERHIAVMEERLEVDIAQSRHGEVVGELRQLVVRFPLREHLHGLLMLALYRSGRQADALEVFQQARRHLRDELGIEPGAGLRGLHQQILAADPALDPDQGFASLVPRADTTAEPAPAHRYDIPVPSQLPHGLADFAGRGAELARLHELLGTDDADGSGQPVLITAIHGTAGVGKTSLAVHWAHQIRHRFPDGQLYVNLRGFDPSGSVMEPAEAIRGFLDAFAVPPQRIPVDLAAQSALYRTVLTGKRVLVVLDNARDAEQVRPLLPGSPGCLAVVTSRNRLTSLVATEGAHPVPVGLLTDAEARQLLRSRVGRARITAEPAAVEEIVARCARLPLALAIVAARAATNPHFPLVVLADQLRRTRGRLDGFDGEDQNSDVRAVFSWSYQSLGDPVARLFRLLGLHPGTHLTTAVAASLAAVSRREVNTALGELARANLIEERSPGRFAFHDLLRAYARELAHDVETDGDRRAATRRMLDHYLHTAHAADRLLSPHRDALTVEPPAPGVTVEELSDHGQALTWFTTEHAVLLAAVEVAAVQKFDDHAWQMPWTLTTYFDRQGHWNDQVLVQRTAVEAARRTATPADQAHAHSCLARAYSQLRRNADAHAHLQQALALYADADDHAGQGHTLLAIAHALYWQNRNAEALSHAQRALALFRDSDHRAGQAAALNAVGWFRSLLDDHENALACCEEALALHRELGDTYGEAAALDSLGYAHHQLHHHDRAVACYQQALDRFRALGDRFNEAGTLGRLGDALHARNDVPAACAVWRSAEAILDALHHPDADRIRRRISDSTESLCA